MNKKITGSTASGKTQPEIRLGDIWRDGYGECLTITGFTATRVAFIRHGYYHPCKYPISRFLKEFTFVRGGQKDAG